MKGHKADKTKRILGIYTRLLNGDTINKEQEARKYGVHQRSIQRDINDIRKFLDLDARDTGYSNMLEYVRAVQGYRMEQLYRIKLTNGEILAICKILLDSRALVQEEMMNILRIIISCCVPKDNRELVEELVRNEAFHYVEPRHGTSFLARMWSIGLAIHSCNYVEIRYYRLKDKRVVRRKIRPVAIMFSEYYFYLTAFIDDREIKKDFEVMDDSYPTIYRIDRIREVKILDEKFFISNKNRFEEGEFRKRVQFMYGGKLQRVKFRYTGIDIDAVLDRLPTAKVLSEKDGIYTVSAEVFGKGIDMWLRSQGENVEVLECRTISWSQQ